ncbi:MAG: alpha/beta fold hydrolase [Pseudomonadota bacterium]
MVNLHRLLVLTALTVLLVGCASGSKDAFDPVSMDLVELDPNFPPTNVELAFNSGGASLPAYLMVANGRGPHPTVVLLHGYPGNEKNLDLAQSLRRAGFNVLFMHYRGAWGAQGDYSLRQLPQDAVAALQFLRAKGREHRVDALRLSLVGHSMGGFAALKAGSQDARLDCVVGLAASNPGEYAARTDEQLDRFAVYTDGLFMLKNFSGNKAVSELRAFSRQLDLRSAATGLGGKSVLLVAGGNDSVVPPDVQSRLAAAFEANPRVNLTSMIIPGADHSFAGHRQQLQRTVVGWLSNNCR